MSTIHYIDVENNPNTNTITTGSLVTFRVDKDGKARFVDAFNFVNSESALAGDDDIRTTKIAEQMISAEKVRRERFSKMPYYTFGTAEDNTTEVFTRIMDSARKAYNNNEPAVQVYGHNLPHDFTSFARTAAIYGFQTPFKREFFITPLTSPTKGLRLIKNPNNPSCYITKFKDLSLVAFVDTMELFSSSITPNFTKNYADQYTNYVAPTGEKMCSKKLAVMGRIVKNDLNYVQAHSSLVDCLDLHDVVKSMVKFDGWKNVWQPASLVRRGDNRVPFTN